MASYIENLFSLKGQVAVVSGGTGVLCGAMAEGLAGAGAEVYLLGRSAEKAAARIEKIESQALVPQLRQFKSQTLFLNWETLQSQTCFLT